MSRNCVFMQECPVCGEALKAGVAVCRYCGAVLDEEKAARYRVARPRLGGAHVDVAVPSAMAAAPAAAMPPRGHRV